MFCNRCDCFQVIKKFVLDNMIIEICINCSTDEERREWVDLISETTNSEVLTW
jgi:hypothetical protein